MSRRWMMAMIRATEKDLERKYQAALKVEPELTRDEWYRRRMNTTQNRDEEL